MSDYSLGLDASEAEAALSELNLYLRDLPLQFRELLLQFFDAGPKLFSFEGGSTVGTSYVATLKPSNRLLDLLFALRTGEFERLRIEAGRGHGGEATDSPPAINRK